MPIRSEEWERIQAEGRTRFLLRRGILVRGVPMALLVVLLIQAWEGQLGRELLSSPRFYGRLLFALVVFSLGGVASAYARWKALESRFEPESSGPARDE